MSLRERTRPGLGTQMTDAHTKAVMLTKLNIKPNDARFENVI
jgi:hypothetical protein